MTASKTRAAFARRPVRFLLLSLLATLVVTDLAEAQRQDTSKGRALSLRQGGYHQIIVPGSQETIQALADRHGLRIRKRLRQGGALEATPSQLEALRRDPNVGHISEDVIVRSSMDVAARSVGADQAWEGVGPITGVSGAGIGVAIIDSGVSPHPELAGRVVASVDLRRRGAGRAMTSMATALMSPASSPAWLPARISSTCAS